MICETASAWMPRELLGRGVRQDASHRAIVELEHPYAVAVHLKHDAVALRRHRGRASETTPNWRGEAFASARAQVKHVQGCLVAVGDSAAVGKPRRAPHLPDAIGR